MSMPSRRSQGAAAAAEADKEPPRTPVGSGGARDEAEDVDMEQEGGRGGDIEPHGEEWEGPEGG